jgi:hypothetical protein
MKKITLSIISALLCVLCAACSSQPPEAAERAANSAQTNNVLINSNASTAAPPQSSTVTYGAYDGFSGTGYTFEFGSFGDNYVITANAAEHGKTVSFTVEDNDYNSAAYSLHAPEGYYASPVSEKNCIILKAPRDNPDVPDILQMNFSSAQGEADVSLFYGIKSRGLMPIGLYTTIPYTLSEMAFCTDTVLIRTEDYKFMPPPVPAWGENGLPAVNVFTYTFDPNRMTLTKAAEAVSPDNTLYYSYSVLSSAEDIVSIYTSKNLPAQSDTDFISVKNADTGENEHYFKINDPRFSTTEELLAFTNRYFAPEITDTLFAGAPQKYRDIDGELYAVKVSGQTPKPFPVITDVLREDTDISVQLSGGGVIVIRPGEGAAFTVLKYSVV